MQKTEVGAARPKLFKALIGPQDEVAIGTIGMPLHLLQSDARNGMPFYLTAAIRYDDIFRKHHVTKYCYVIGLSSEPDGVLKPTSGLCEHWNCADDECLGDRSDYQAETTGTRIAPSRPVSSPILPGQSLRSHRPNACSLSGDEMHQLICP